MKITLAYIHFFNAISACGQAGAHVAMRIRVALEQEGCQNQTWLARRTSVLRPGEFLQTSYFDY